MVRRIKRLQKHKQRRHGTNSQRCVTRSSILVGGDQRSRSGLNSSSRLGDDVVGDNINSGLGRRRGHLGDESGGVSEGRVSRSSCGGLGLNRSSGGGLSLNRSRFRGLSLSRRRFGGLSLNSRLGHLFSRGRSGGLSWNRLGGLGRFSLRRSGGRGLTAQWAEGGVHGLNTLHSGGTFGQTSGDLLFGTFVVSTRGDGDDGRLIVDFGVDRSDRGGEGSRRGSSRGRSGGRSGGGSGFARQWAVGGVHSSDTIHSGGDGSQASSNSSGGALVVGARSDGDDSAVDISGSFSLDDLRVGRSLVVEVRGHRNAGDVSGGDTVDGSDNSSQHIDFGGGGTSAVGAGGDHRSDSMLVRDNVGFVDNRVAG